MAALSELLRRAQSRMEMGQGGAATRSRMFGEDFARATGDQLRPQDQVQHKPQRPQAHTGMPNKAGPLADGPASPNPDMPEDPPVLQAKRNVLFGEAFGRAQADPGNISGRTQQRLTAGARGSGLPHGRLSVDHAHKNLLTSPQLLAAVQTLSRRSLNQIPAGQRSSYQDG